MAPYLTGTIIKNFFHCQRQAYLFAHGLNFRNDLVRIGELLHEQQQSKELVFEKIKVDDIKDSVLIEYKKTSSNLEGTRMQVLHYLDALYEKGLQLTGKIIDLTYGKEYIVQLTEETQAELHQTKKIIKEMIEGTIPEGKHRRADCKGCSFKDYCWTP